MIGTALGLLLLMAAPDLEGTWVGARFTEGKGDDPAKGEPVEFTFKGSALAGRKGNGTLIGEATFTIAADGKSIDAVGATGGYKGKTYLGILKLEGDTLTWCSSGTAGKSQKRPADFTADSFQGKYLIVLKRRKP